MLVSALLFVIGCEGDLPAPSGRRGARGAVDDGVLWVVGGEDAAGLSSEVWSFDLGDRQWRRRTDAPVPMAWGAMGWDGAAFVVLAGVTPDGVSDQVWRLDPRADSWDPLAPMPVPRARSGAVMAGETLYLTGGLGPEGEAYGDAWTLHEGVWNQVSTDLGVGGFADVTLTAGDSTVFQVGGTLAPTRDFLYTLDGSTELALHAVDVGRGSLPGACGFGSGSGTWLWDGVVDATPWSWVGSWVAHPPEGAAPVPRGYAMCATGPDALYVLGGDEAFGVGAGPYLRDLWRLRDGKWKAILDVDGVPVEE